MKKPILISIIFIIISCAGNISTKNQTENINYFSVELEQLASWMSGSFSSTQQSIADSNYFDINLEMDRIWHERNDAIWLYVEQASSKRLIKPYRQRVYKLTQNENIFLSKVYEVSNPEKFIGAFNKNELFDTFGPEELIERVGCTVIMEYNNSSFKGSTKDKECLSSLFGATYATSEVEIFSDKVLSWDRGFNSSDEHIWGAEKGPYYFLKK